MLKITNLKAGYGEEEVLHGVNLEVNPSEIVVLVGLNGSGKSTILNSVFNLADVFNGKIFFKNKNITGLKAHQVSNLGIGFVFQDRNIFPNLTVLENLQMGAYLLKDKINIKNKIEKTFKEFPMLKEKKNSEAFSLSGGQQRILALAMVLVLNPQLIFLDEPSLGLSPMIAKEMFKKITELKNGGVAVLMVEQNAEDAMNIADRTYLLRDGKVISENNKNRIKKEICNL